MYISQSENSKSKIWKFCNFACSNPAREFFFSFWDNGKSTFSRSCDLESCDLKIKNFKMCYFACSNPARVKNLLCFALSFTVYEIMANLLFRGHATLRVMWPKNQKFQNVLFCIKNLLFRYISYGLWDTGKQPF